ncbi:MAG: carbohydrate binding domain-containing protein [Gaiellales bacterium]
MNAPALPAGGVLAERLTRPLELAPLVLVTAALALPLTAAPQLDESFSGPGGVSIFVADVIVALAVGCWAIGRLVQAREDRPAFRTPLVGWPVLVFALALVPGIGRGHVRWDSSLIGQPARLALYAAIAAAVAGTRPRDLYRAITAVFYAGTFWQTALATYHLATDTAQTPIRILSTGGTRTLALLTAMYLGGALILALLNLDLDRDRRRHVLHLVVAVLASLGVVLSFSRTSFVALLAILPVLVWALPQMRRNVRRLWPLWAPLAVAVFAGVALAVPSFGPTLADRVSANPLEDQSVRFRLRAIGAALGGFRGEPPIRPGVVRYDTAPNVLTNGSFEGGTRGWLVQGGELSTVPSNNLNFGHLTLRMTTDGRNEDQGLYSELIPTKAGENWTFSVWLKGAEGGERVTVSLWAYDARDQGIAQTNAPVSLTVAPGRYSVTTRIEDPTAVGVRALVRTASFSQAVTVLADEARVERFERESPRSALPDSNFEFGTGGWRNQGGNIANPPLEAVYGSHSLSFTTDGSNADQGPYSPFAPALPSEAWTFSLWLKGAEGGERLNLGIWEYDANGEGLAQGNLPVVLTTEPKRYSFTWVISSDATRRMRAVIRTRSPRKVTAYADGVHLERAVPPFPFLPLGNRPVELGEVPSGALQADEVLLGSGFGRESTFLFEGRVYPVVGGPDNSYVFVLAGGGVLALGGLLLVMAVFVRDTWRRIRASAGYERALVIWALATWFMFMVNCLMAPFLPRPKLVLTIWALMVIPAIVAPHAAGRPWPRRLVPRRLRRAT